MTSKERMVIALDRGKPDRLPVTTHHVMPDFLDAVMDGMSNVEFFDHFGLDPIHWCSPMKGDETRGETLDPLLGVVQSDTWHVSVEEFDNAEYLTKRFTFDTPGGTLVMVCQFKAHTAWMTEHPVKKKNDIDLIAEYAPAPLCDVDEVNRIAERWNDRLIRGGIPCFDIFGQPGCWQDACCLAGVETMIMATYDDPEWVHTFLDILQRRKLAFVNSMAGAQFDVLELGGGDASSTVISPGIFDKFVAPYDAPIIEAAHKAGQRIVYHTCGGMMPILENIAAMGPDAMETFTPAAMGGDADLADAKRRIGDRVCMIGGFDQYHYFTGCTEAETRAAVRRCFDEAGGNGGFILAPSDHFFEADKNLLNAFADEARKCTY
jgi:hypothetical protein